MPTCERCDDTGVIETGNNDLPCACRAGDTAVFNVAGIGQIAGRELKRPGPLPSMTGGIQRVGKPEIQVDRPEEALVGAKSLLHLAVDTINSLRRQCSCYSLKSKCPRCEKALEVEHRIYGFMDGPLKFI